MSDRIGLLQFFTMLWPDREASSIVCVTAWLENMRGDDKILRYRMDGAREEPIYSIEKHGCAFDCHQKGGQQVWRHRIDCCLSRASNPLRAFVMPLLLQMAHCIVGCLIFSISVFCCALLLGCRHTECERIFIFPYFLRTHNRITPLHRRSTV